ncbi:MAG: hypothetical protein Q9M18_06800, partial [Mariprofundaceae bacterium]|nr:hypothetical protein [Mariprofundaceae bacterium]
MIEIPKQYRTALLTTKSTKRGIRFNSIVDKYETIRFVERRLAPTRRQPQQAKNTIERRVSSDRRRPSFSSKA